MTVEASPCTCRDLYLPEPATVVSKTLLTATEMLFEMRREASGIALSAYYWRNDYLGIEQYSRYRNAENYVVISALYVEHEDFARQWDQNLRAQGFLEAFTDTSIRG